MEELEPPPSVCRHLLLGESEAPICLNQPGFGSVASNVSNDVLCQYVSVCRGFSMLQFLGLSSGWRSPAEYAMNSTILTELFSSWSFAQCSFDEGLLRSFAATPTALFYCITAPPTRSSGFFASRDRNQHPDHSHKDFQNVQSFNTDGCLLSRKSPCTDAKQSCQANAAFKSGSNLRERHVHL